MVYVKTLYYTMFLHKPFRPKVLSKVLNKTLKIHDCTGRDMCVGGGRQAHFFRQPKHTPPVE